jgi:hypothetical protein
MELSRPRRPRVSRETRRLLSTAVLAVLALWILARARFPDQPPATTPLQPLLTQLSARPTFDELASELAELRTRLEPVFVGAALRIHPDVALAVAGADRSTHTTIAADPVTGVTILDAPGADTPPPQPWRPDDLRQPRYLIAAEASAGALALRPVLAGPLIPTPSPLWREPLWRLPSVSEAPAGAFVFTTDARLVGLIVDIGGESAIVPTAALLDEVARLLTSGAHTVGYVGVDVQVLTPALMRATGTSTGVIVAWVDPDGPAAQSLAIGDVIEAIDEQPLLTPQQWTARTARVPAGHTLMVRVRRGDTLQTVGIITAPQRRASDGNVLGMVLRDVRGTGSMVVDVQAGSAADRAGLRAGDVITQVGATKAPSPAAVRGAFARATADAGVLVGYRRSDAHAVTSLEKR